MEIIDLKPSHLKEAGELFLASYQRQRMETPILDESNGKAGKVMAKLMQCLEHHPGVAAVANGRLTGYMTGFYLHEFLGVHKGVLSPEWAHGAENANSFEIYRCLYKEIGQQWMEQGCLTHAVNFMNYAREAQDAFCWNGFGRVCIDAMREVQPIAVDIPDRLIILPIQAEDVSVWLPLVERHNRHVATSPAFKPYLEVETKKDLRNLLQQPGNYAWMAWWDGEAVGYMKVAPVEDGAAWIVNGEKKVAVNGLFVKPDDRGKGIAKTLLAKVMDWAAEEGFMRCSVDFEATNIEACHFWLKYFQPVCKSMIRRLDERIRLPIS